jgi:hypothetical protein
MQKISSLPTFLTALVVILSATGCLSQTAQASSSDTTSVTAVCTELQQQKQTIQSGKTSRLSILLKLFFERNSLIAPKEVSPTQQEASLPTIENMTVFTLGHPEKLTDQEKSKDKAQLKSIREASIKEAKSLQQLLATSSVDDCVAEAQKINWSPQELTDLQNLETSALEAYRHQESEASEKVAAKVKKEHPKWKVVPVDSWGEISQNLRKSNPTGIVMIVHSSPSGRLFDSLRDELPTPFFKALPSSVKFVGIFSCDSAQVEKAYSLDDPSLGREFITVKLGSPFDKSESTPIQFLPTWISKVAREKLDEQNSAPTQAEPLCSVKMNALKILKGRVSLSIANLPVGVWTTENEDQAQLFPCSWINVDHSQLYAFVQPSSLDNPADLADTNFSVEITTDLGNTQGALPTITSPSASPDSSGDKQVFKTVNGQFRSAIFRF